MQPEQTIPDNVDLSDIDPSSDLDAVPVFSDSGAMAEMEALAIRGILEANGIPSTISGVSTLPVTEFVVLVSKNRLEEARSAILEAEASGPRAAEEGERESEAAGLGPDSV